MKNIYGESLSLRNLGVEEPEEDNDFLTQYIEIVKANISNQDLDVSVNLSDTWYEPGQFLPESKNGDRSIAYRTVKDIRLEAGAKLLKDPI